MKQLLLIDGERSATEPTFSALARTLSIDNSPSWPDAFGCQLRQHVAGCLRKRITTLSLFSGAGGLDIGFHDAGFHIPQMVEINSRYAETLQRNAASDGYFRAGVVSPVDVCDLLKGEPLHFDGAVDCIIGGPPCQTFSAAGRRAAGVRGTSEARGTLFEEYVRILKELKPKAFVFENVYGITGAEDGQAWSRIKGAFADAGYALFHRILDAADYGVPQHRERMFIVGIRGRGEFFFPRPTHGPDSPDQHPFNTPGRALEDVRVDTADMQVSLSGRHGDLLPQIPPGLNYAFFTEKMGHPRPIFAWRSKFSDFLYKADPASPVRTIKAFCGKYTGPFHWENRRFTVDELKRLQTFPDSYPIEGTRGLVLQQIGNSVPPQMARIIAVAVLNQVFAPTPVIQLSYLDHDEPLGFRQRKRAISTSYFKRARAAVQRLGKQSSHLLPRKQAYVAGVDESFHFVRDPGQSVFVQIALSVGQSLSVFVTRDRRRTRTALSIVAQPAQTMDWGLPFEQVELRLTELDRQLYLVAWRALQAYMAEARLRDDLVQLYGYYAYEPQVCNRASIETDDGDVNWSRLAEVVNGIGTRQILAAADLCGIFRLTKQQLNMWLLFLRDLGHEVRSNLTNPQIPSNSFLIPYSFPTLTRESVQRSKVLL